VILNDFFNKSCFALLFLILLILLEEQKTQKLNKPVDKSNV